MKLYTTPFSPYGRKIRAMLIEKELKFEVEMVDLTAAENPLRALNPLGKVPTLVTDDGEVHFDSMMLAEMVDAMPGAQLIPNAPARWAALRAAALGQGMADVT